MLMMTLLLLSSGLSGAQALHNPRDNADISSEQAMTISSGIDVKPTTTDDALLFGGGGGGGGSTSAGTGAGGPATSTAALVDLDDLFGAPADKSEWVFTLWCGKFAQCHVALVNFGDAGLSASPIPFGGPAPTSFAPATAAPPAKPAATASLLDDLFGAPPAPAPAPVTSVGIASYQTPAPAGPAFNLASLYGQPAPAPAFGGLSAMPAQPPLPPTITAGLVTSSVSPGGSGDLFGAFSSSTSPGVPVVGGFPPLVAYEGGGLKVVFSFNKPEGPASDNSDILVTVTNSTPLPFTNFQFQAAVPKVLCSCVVCLERRGSLVIDVMLWTLPLRACST